MSMSLASSSFIDGNVNACKKHKRMKEICCIQCKEVICTKCALFEHRDHVVREVEEVYAEMAENVEQIMQLQHLLKSTKAKVDARSWEPILIHK